MGGNPIRDLVVRYSISILALLATEYYFDWTESLGTNRLDLLMVQGMFINIGAMWLVKKAKTPDWSLPATRLLLWSAYFGGFVSLLAYVIYIASYIWIVHIGKTHLSFHERFRTDVMLLFEVSACKDLIFSILDLRTHMQMRSALLDTKRLKAQCERLSTKSVAVEVLDRLHTEIQRAVRYDTVEDFTFVTVLLEVVKLHFSTKPKPEWCSHPKSGSGDPKASPSPKKCQTCGEFIRQQDTVVIIDDTVAGYYWHCHTDCFSSDVLGRSYHDHADVPVSVIRLLRAQIAAERPT